MTRSPLSASVSSGASGEGLRRRSACASTTSRRSARSGVSAIAVREQMIERARTLAFGALRTGRLGGLIPGEDIAMQPGLGGTHEAAQEQRRRDRARKAAGGDIVHLRHLGIEHLVIGAPQR